MYILKNTRGPYVARVKKAESRLADLNNTINYEVKKKIVEIERHNQHLQKLVHKDSLVDAYNKKGIMNILKEMVEEPGSERFTIMLFDIDDFKRINDSQGHITGDKVLKKVARIAKENIRGFDILGRYGGDEFLIILPGTTLTDAMIVAERFRKSIGSEPELSVSIGVAAFPEDGKAVQEIIEVADAGLYESKRIGKNAVSHATGR
jgi:diguanylate cyclase (GGDEF)-like protein